ncbi:hypothetical protein [Mesorhizobium sp. Pch-S]|uniref:hypothetical protein n=1 Tax=Mesorhizobium sp. Pch-S TaxID=2082387 RepID=UPI001010BD1B|nr:hypothetical protein [Mesorhizobium sp. Pch-S]QAZ46134.1 hypothetical protein C1M53_27610 [Mesorhizobium sp. Pch-S]
MEKPEDKNPSGKRGRPAYRPALKDRQTVEQMKFCGESENTIARSLGIDVGTLRKHFAEELENGYANRRHEVIGLLFEAARSKNVAAIKKLEEMGRVANAAEAVNGRGKGERQPKLGKKEERQIAARNVGGKFATRQPPQLVAVSGGKK